MIIKNINVNKLHTEFNNVSIFPHPVFELDNKDGDFTFPDGADMVLVQQIIDTHDPTPLPEPLSEIDKLKISQAEQFETILMLIGGV